VTLRRLVLLLTLTVLALPAGGLAAEADLVEASEGGASTQADTSTPPTLASSQRTPWWETHPDASDGWKFGLQRLADKHVRDWAVPVSILGGFGLGIFGTGIPLEFSSNFGDPLFLIVGLATLGVSGSIALGSFPCLTSIKRSIRDVDDPMLLHKRFRKMRTGFGWAALGAGIGGSVLGLLSPLSYGVAVIPAAFMALCAAVFGQVSLTFLAFEKKVTTFLEAKHRPGRFGQGPHAPVRPQLIAASPLGLTLRF
jgi:hypothetical protein